MEYKFRDLRADEIDVRIATVKKNGISLLLYKDARCDMNILDETVGPNNWQRDHKELKGNIYCGISIWDKEKQAWITKWDCGSESYTEKEKGEASDSFKRAGFNWGIGRELYTSPFIWITSDKCTIKEDKYKKDKYGNPLYTCDDVFNLKSIEIKDKKIVNLEISLKNKVVFNTKHIETKEPIEQLEERKITSAQLKILQEKYTGENLNKLLEFNKISKLSDMSMRKASELISKLKGVN